MRAGSVRLATPFYQYDSSRGKLLGLPCSRVRSGLVAYDLLLLRISYYVEIHGCNKAVSVRAIACMLPGGTPDTKMEIRMSSLQQAYMHRSLKRLNSLVTGPSIIRIAYPYTAAHRYCLQPITLPVIISAVTFIPDR